MQGVCVWYSENMLPMLISKPDSDRKC